MSLTVVQLMTGAKVSKYLMPSTFLSPRAQNLALSLRLDPSGYHLHRNAQVEGSIFIHG